jgi:hypothetical protein
LIDFNDAAPAAPARYDLDEIVRRLRDTAESWVPHHFPNGRRNGNEWRLANINGHAPRKNGSCVIALKGERAGDWHDFDGNQGGGPLNALEKATGLVDRQLFAYAAETAGWLPGAPPREARATAPASTEDATRHEIAFILKHSGPIAGTPAEAYLRGRGLSTTEATDLLFHPDLTHWETKTGFPGMVAVVRDRDGEPIALHRTYLQVTSSGEVTKATVSKPRMMLGKVAGSAVRLAAIGDDGILALSEGIETGLAVMSACPGLAVWATLSTAGLEQVRLPPEARRIIILADHDESGAGLRAAETARLRLAAEGRQVVIATPPTRGDDFNDMLGRDGPDAVATVVRTAFLGEASDAKPIRAIGRHLPIGFAEPRKPLPTLRADEGDLEQAVRSAWKVLLDSNREPWLFRAAGLPAWIVPDDEGRPVATRVTEERLRHMLAKIAAWQRTGRNGSPVPAHPPTPLIKSLLATPDPDLPALTGIVTAPVFGRDGTLVTQPGYHPETRLFYHAPAGFVVQAIPDRPTTEATAAARSMIAGDLLGEFPFTSAAERAHAIALLLLSFVRAMVDGPTPLHLIEKPSPGTGATLMIDAIATIATGAGASVMTEGRDEDEWRKRITAKLREIPALVLIDNLRNRLDSAALAAALTAPYWEDRILGVSEMTRLPIRCVWMATGNNPTFSNELARRIVRIRLDARTDQPWRRDGFRHPDLMGWVRANRARLVAACLTLCRAWIGAGRPRGGRTMGSFESWSQVMGGVLEVIGIEGFLGNLDEMIEASDAEGATWRSFVSLWWDRFGTAEVGTSALYELALGAEPPLPLGSGNERAQRTRLGKALARLRDRTFRMSGFTVRAEAQGSYQGALRWRLSLDEKTGTDERSRRSPDSPDLVNVVNVGERANSNVHDESDRQLSALTEVGERRERFSHPYAYARAHAHAKEDPEKRSQRSRRSPDPEKSATYAGKHPGERPAERSQRSPAADPLSFDAIFNAHGLDPLSDDDRLAAVRIWLAQCRGPPGDKPDT